MKLANLKTDGARLLYTWLIPNLDINGCYSGDPEIVRSHILTRLNKSRWRVARYLADLKKNKLVILYNVNGDRFLHVPDFTERQPRLNTEKEAIGIIPLPNNSLVGSNSRLALDQLPTNSRPPPELLPTRRGSESESLSLSKNEKGEIYFDFKKSFISSSPRLVGLHWDDVVRPLMKLKNKGDVSCLNDIRLWLIENIKGGRFNVKIFDNAWQWAVDSQTGQVPMKVFQSKLKTELGYKCKSEREADG